MDERVWRTIRLFRSSRPKMLLRIVVKHTKGIVWLFSWMETVGRREVGISSEGGIYTLIFIDYLSLNTHLHSFSYSIIERIIHIFDDIKSSEIFIPFQL